MGRYAIHREFFRLQAVLEVFEVFCKNLAQSTPWRRSLPLPSTRPATLRSENETALSSPADGMIIVHGTMVFFLQMPLADTVIASDRMPDEEGAWVCPGSGFSRSQMTRPVQAHIAECHSGTCSILFI